MIASGFDASVFDSISPAFSACGLRADVELAVAWRRHLGREPRPLQPGDALGVALLRRRLPGGATGTVTTWTAIASMHSATRWHNLGRRSSR
jgi:hypothetical protein